MCQDRAEWIYIYLWSLFTLREIRREHIHVLLYIILTTVHTSLVYICQNMSLENYHREAEKNTLSTASVQQQPSPQQDSHHTGSA